MPKQRAPISTRLRNKDKKIEHNQEISPDSIKKEEYVLNSTRIEDNILFSPRIDTGIYLDELQSPLSFVRGTSEEKAQYLKDEDNILCQAFGKDYKSNVNTSSFYCAQLSSPVPSKRTRHLHSTVPKSLTGGRSSVIHESIKKIKIPFPMTSKRSVSPVRSLSPSPSPSPSTTPTPAPVNNKRLSTTPKGKKTISSMNSYACLPTGTLESLSSSSAQFVSAKDREKKPLKSNTHPHSLDSANDKSSIEDLSAVPLPMSKKLPVYIKMNAKDKEKEYWRRQRRAFIHSRFLTSEEGVQVAKSVYSNLSIGPTSQLVVSMQGNISNFRTKLRRIFTNQTDKFDIPKEHIINTNEEQLIQEVTLMMTDKMLDYVWGHWISDPYVNVEEFYSNTSAVNLLRSITVKITIIHLKEYYNILSPKEARTEMRKLDLLSRTINLPEPAEYQN